LTTTRFFRLALLLPVVAAAAFANAVFIVSIFFWLPYLLIAVPAFIALGRAKSLERILTISVAAPFAMLLVLAPLSLGLAPMGMLIVAAFVALAWFLYGIGRMAGWVLAMPPNTSLERTREG